MATGGNEGDKGAFPPNGAVTRNTGLAVALVAIIVVAAGLRSCHISPPPLDFPADRQVNTAVLIEAWSGGRPLSAFQFIHPSRRTDPRVLMPEAPIVPLLTAGVARLLPKGAIAPFTIARLWTVFFSLLTLALIFDLGRRWLGARAGLFAAGAFAILPASVYFGRAVIPDVPMTAFMAASLCAADRFFAGWGAGPDGRRSRSLLWAAIALIALAAATLAKLPALIAAFPLLVFSNRRLKDMGLLVWFACLVGAVCGPLFLYYPLSLFSLGPDMETLSRQTNSLLQTFVRNGASASYLLILLNRIELALTGGGAVLALAGAAMLFARPQTSPLRSWLLASVLFTYLAVGANTYWDYLLLPPACLCMAVALEGLGQWIGSSALSGARRALVWALLLPAAAAGILLSASFQKVAQAYYKEDETILRAGEFVRNHTPPHVRLATCGEVPFDLLWASDRKGWSVRKDEGSFLLRRRTGRWEMAAVARPGDFETFRVLFEGFPCVAAQSGVALFAKARSRSLADDSADTVIAATPPVEFENGLRLVGSGLSALRNPESAAGSKPTTLCVTLVWDTADAPTFNPAGLFVAIRWRHDLASRSDAAFASALDQRFHLPPIAGAVNFPGENFTRGQFAAIVEPFTGSLPGVEAGARGLSQTRWTFGVPRHLPPATYRLEVALGSFSQKRWFTIRPQGGLWAGLNAISIGSGPVLGGKLKLIPSEFFFSKTEYGDCPPQNRVKEGVTIEPGLGDVFIDPGEYPAKRLLTLDARPRPFSGGVFSIKAYVNGQRSDGYVIQYKGYRGSKHSYVALTCAVPSSQKEPKTWVWIPDASREAPVAVETPWPLYLDETTLPTQGAILREAILIQR